MINKRKKLLNDGKDPDEVEEEIKRKRKEKRLKRFKRKHQNDKNNKEISVKIQQDTNNDVNCLNSCK